MTSLLTDIYGDVLITARNKFGVQKTPSEVVHFLTTVSKKFTINAVHELLRNTHRSRRYDPGC
jgi:hypothetical protein